MLSKDVPVHLNSLREEEIKAYFTALVIGKNKSTFLELLQKLIISMNEKIL